MHKLRENAEKELHAIEEKGLTSSNLENAYKLTEIIKGIDKIEMMQDSGDYSRNRYSRDREDYVRDDDYDNGNSYRRGRNRRTGEYMHRPNYSRLAGDDSDMDKYRQMKREYSNTRDAGSKEKMLDALEDFMSGVSGMMKQLFKDSDCREEREIIQRYAREIANM